VSSTSDERTTYQQVQASADFQNLRRRFRNFAFPMTVAFLAWYLLYVIMSGWARDFMGTKLVGNINVALVFGLLQFASTFTIAALYARHMNTHVDPLARSLTARYDDELRGERGDV
jgi:uncharacterized membrane protein (DUF485 family)